MKLTLHRMLTRDKRHLWIYGAILLVLLLIIVGYIASSAMAWSSFKQKTDETIGVIRAKTDAAFQRPITDDRSRDEKTRAIAAIHTVISEYEQCSISNFYEWQQVIINSYKTALRQCEAQAGQLHNFSKSVNDVVVYLQHEKQLAYIIGDAALPSALGDAEWNNALQKWSETEKKVTRLSPLSTFTKTKETTLQRVGAIKAAWQELIDAGRAKDRKRYEAATTRLGQSFTAFADIKGVSETELLALVNKMDSSYRQAFKNK